jgi:hypothetical protein
MEAELTSTLDGPPAASPIPNNNIVALKLVHIVWVTLNSSDIIVIIIIISSSSSISTV